MVRLVKSFGFEAAHWLPSFPEGHKCRRMHGHSFHGEVAAEGPLAPARGFLMDSADITKLLAPLEAELDHRVLT
ncbi:MAG: 6-pyruvoyl trahydropterin synthase family protein, partial [Phycisphaerales bacterium]